MGQTDLPSCGKSPSFVMAVKIRMKSDPALRWIRRDGDDDGDDCDDNVYSADMSILQHHAHCLNAKYSCFSSFKECENAF